MQDNEELAVRIQNGEQELIAQLWEQNTGIIYLKANGLYTIYRELCISSGVTLDDIVQICYFALCEAIQAFKPEGEYKLLSYLNFPLLNHFRALLGIRTSKRNPLNQCQSLNDPAGDKEGETERLDLIVDPSSEEPFETVIEDILQAKLHEAIDKAISKLPEDRAALIHERYFEGKTLGQIASEMGKKPQYVHSLLRQVFAKLRRDCALKAFQEELLSTLAYKNTGLRAFRETWTSSVERAILRIEELTGT